MPAVVCIKSDNLPDWYTIELAVHENKRWMEPTDYGAKLMYSGRISDACVEGTSEEMLAIAAAIKTRQSVSFRRCEADHVDNGYLLSSPRNSQEPGFISFSEADALAESITSVVAGIKLTREQAVAEEIDS